LGIGSNIYNLANKHKVNPDKIAVIIVEDGINKVD